MALSGNGDPENVSGSLLTGTSAAGTAAGAPMALKSLSLGLGASFAEAQD